MEKCLSLEKIKRKTETKNKTFNEQRKYIEIPTVMGKNPDIEEWVFVVALTVSGRPNQENIHEPEKPELHTLSVLLPGVSTVAALGTLDPYTI